METIDVNALAKDIADKLNHVELIGEEKLEGMAKEALVNPNTKYAKPISLIQMVGDKKNFDILTTGNISMTIGAAKSKKTFYSTMMAAALLGFKDHGIIGNNQGLKTIFFDTEQSKYHVQRLNYRINKLAGNLLNFELYSLRELGQDERRALIEYQLEKNKDNFSFVFIDGIVDLIYDFNNQEQCANMINDLMRWSTVYNCHINVVLHITVSFGNAKGHLGSLLTNKVECVFRVTKDDDKVSIVSCEASRNESFPEFRFRVDENGLPVRDSLPTGFFNQQELPEKLPEPISNTDGLEPVNFDNWDAEANPPPF